MTDGSRASGYGTVELDVVAIEQGSAPQASRAKRAFAGFVVVALCVAAVVALSGTSDSHVNSALNSNRYKTRIAPAPGVAEVCMHVSNLTLNGQRWAIFGFPSGAAGQIEDDYKQSIKPLMEDGLGSATQNQEHDWLEFRGAMDAVNDVAMAIYNFEYQVDNDSTDMETILISYKPKMVRGIDEFGKKTEADGTTPMKVELDPREVARAGYFLGSVILACDDYVDRHVAIESLAETYEDFCIEDMLLTIPQCQAASKFEGCPFKEGTEDDFSLEEINPCVVPQCRGAKFAPPDAEKPGDIPIDCCDYIQEAYCVDYPESHGCDGGTSEIIGQLCEIQALTEAPTLLVTPEETQICDPQFCIQPCETVQYANEKERPDKAHTWRLCSGCPTDNGFHDMTDDGIENKLQYLCHPLADGFQKERCCGIADVCNEHEAESSEMLCAAMEYYDCSFQVHAECPAIKDAQVQKAAPGGCCETYPKSEEVREYFEFTQKLEHTFTSTEADGTKSVNCGEEFEVWGPPPDNHKMVGFTTEKQKEVMNFVWHPEDLDCAVIKDEYQRGADDEAAAHELRLAILANQTVTEAPVRRMGEHHNHHHHAKTAKQIADEKYAEMYRL